MSSISRNGIAVSNTAHLRFSPISREKVPIKTIGVVPRLPRHPPPALRGIADRHASVDRSSASEIRKRGTGRIALSQAAAFQEGAIEHFAGRRTEHGIPAADPVIYGCAIHGMNA